MVQGDLCASNEAALCLFQGVRNVALRAQKSQFGMLLIKVEGQGQAENLLSKSRSLPASMRMSEEVH